MDLNLSHKKGLFLDEGSLDLYLQEIGNYPLIDRKQEISLAKRIKRGDQRAMDKLVRANLRFVVSVAKKYQNQGLPLSDLISEGNLGLMRAARKFDERKGIKFISYAVWWIRQGILQALAEQSRIVRLPLNRAGMLHKIYQKVGSLTQELEREPTTDELAHELEIELEEIEKTLSIAKAHLSFEAPMTPGENNLLREYLPDETSPPTSEMVEDRIRIEAIEDSLKSLSAREAKIIRLYYGLDHQGSMTLEEIGKILGITRERVRQIKEKALQRLRHISRSNRLKAYTESM